MGVSKRVALNTDRKNYLPLVAVLLGVLLLASCSSSLDDETSVLLIQDDESLYSMSLDDRKRTELFEAGEEEDDKPLTSRQPETVSSFQLGRFSPSPNGSSILMIADRDNEENLYVLDDGGTDLTQLTYFDQDAYIQSWNVSWSSDGDRILLIASEDNEENLYVVDNDGSDFIQVTFLDDSQDLYQADWLIGKDRILLAATDDGESNLYAVDSDGANLSQITFFDDSITLWSFEISTGGKKILLNLGEGGEDKLYVMDLDGGNLSEVVSAVGDTQIWNARFSPNGDQIMFILEDETKDTLYVMDANGSNLRDIVSINKSESKSPWSTVLGSATYSHTGDRISFVAEVNDERNLYVVDNNGANLTQLTSNDDIETLGNGGFSPTGKHILFDWGGELRIFDFLKNQEMSIGKSSYAVWANA